MNMATELELGQQSVQLSELVKRAAEDSYLALEELINRCPDQSDGQRKISLLKYIFKTRQRLLRLHVLTKWCTQIPLVQYCQQLEGSLSSHDMCFTQAADTLFFTHEGLQQARQPVYDVPSALEVLLTGTYCRLPKCVEDMGMQTALVGEERELALPKLDTLLRSRLLEASLPDEISSITVSDGRVVLRVEGEFKVQLTLGYRGYLSLWRILHLELLVGERSGPLKLTEMQRFNLGDDLERRMAAADNPFATLYSILHDFCIALVMDTVLRQAKTLRQGRWKDAIRFELISDSSSGQAGNSGHTQASDGDADASGLRTPGLKIMYWLDLPKGMGGADSGCIPFLKIEPGKDQCISCSHNTYVIDPVTGNQAEFVLDQSCIDVEHLLLRAISCNIHTRLLEVQRVLKSNNQLYQVDDDIILKHPGDTSNASLNKIMEFFQKNPSADTGQLGEEVLCVRAYGLSYVALGINIRNGRFLLRSSRNLILSSAVTECEEALNQGSVTPAEVFISLRNKSILHVFASVGRFLGLKVYEKGVATVKLPKSVIQGSDLLLMGFPNCRNSYFLLIQLDIDFKPLFMLLESKQDSTGKSGLLSTLHIFRFNKIDIGRMQMVEDEVNLSLLENERLLCLAKDVNGGSDLISKPGRCCESLTDAVIQDQGCLQSGFSSLADDVFEVDKWMPVSQYLPKQNNLLPSAEPSPSSHLGAVQGDQQGAKFAVSPPAWDGNSQFSPMNNTGKISVVSSPFNNRLMSELNHRNVRQTGSSLSAVGHNYGLNTTISSPVRSPPFHKLPASKSYTDQELTSSKSSLHLGDTAAYAALDEDHLRKAMDSPKDGLPAHSSSRTTRVPPLRASPAHRSPVQHSRSSFVKMPSGQAPTMLKSSATGLRMIPSACQTSESGTLDGIICDSILKTSSRKRCLSDIVHSIPSLQGTSAYGEIQKKRKTSELGNTLHAPAQLNTQGIWGQFIGRTCGNIISEANHGKVPSSIYVSVLLQVIRHCSLCIKHARLTSQMEALNIPYVEDVGLRKPSADLWFRLPSSKEDAWQHICLCLGRPGSMSWEVEVNDEHFRDLWELQKGKNGTPWGSGVRIANTSDVDSHIRYGPEGVVLSYRTVEEDSIKKLVADLQRLSNARSFAMGMRKLLEVKSDERTDAGKEQCNMKTQNLMKKVYGEGGDRMWECMRKTFKIEAVGLMSLWFSYLGSMPGIIARFVVEWESGKEGCTMHVSPDQLWPHTKFLEDFINGGEVASLLDCIRLTAGPLHALAGAIRPARMVGTPATGMSLVPSAFSTAAKTNGLIMSQGLAQSMTSSTVNQSMGGISGGGANSGATSGNLNMQNGPVVSVAGRGGPGIVPSSLLPTDVSVVLRSPYWIRIIYRKNFAVDMRCFAGDQVWLQPATPPKDGPAAGGSMPCPQFRPFIMEHVALGLNTLETSLPPHPGGPGNSNNSSTTTVHSPAGSGNRMSTNSSGVSRSTNLPGNPGAILNRGTNVNTVLGAQNLAALNSGLSLAGRPMAPATGVPVHVRGELNTAFIGLGDDGGYGGGWVPLAALKKVLRGILKYLGVLWLFSQLPDLLKVILRSILKENEGSLLNLDHEQPALRFFVGGYVFAVSVHRVQLLLQVLSVKRFHQQQQQQQQHNQTNGQDELTAAEIHEICEYFSGRVASEPYDASRVASFITLLTLPISVLREFLKLIAWKKGTAQGQVGDIASSQKPRVELCLECHMGSSVDSSLENTGQGPSDRATRNVAKSNIHYDRAHNAVDFGLTVVLDPANIPHVNAAGGAAWLPHCVSVRLRYTFGENPHMSLLGMEGSHGGRALWPRMEDWDRCKQKVARAVEIAGSSVDASQGRLRVVAETLQATLLSSLHQLRKGATVNTLSVPGGFTG